MTDNKKLKKRMEHKRYYKKHTEYCLGMTKRWMKNHPEETKEIKEKYYNQNKGNDTNKHQPYTTKEIDLILNKEFPDVELAKMLKRSVRAIQIVRCKYKTV